MSEATGKRERKVYQVREGGSTVLDKSGAPDGKQAKPAPVKDQAAPGDAGDKAKGE